jgi:hypothetical protein
MSWTKRQLAADALAAVGLADYEFDVTPDERQMVIRRLDAMMATWEARGVRVGYLFPATADGSDPDDDSGLPDSAAETVFLNLAIRVAPSFGKTVSQELKTSARDGWDLLLLPAARPIEQQLPSTLPRGAGQKPWRAQNQPFFPRPDTDPMQVGPGGDLDIL